MRNIVLVLLMMTVTSASLPLLADEAADIATVRAFFADYNTMDWDQVNSYFAEDVVLHSMMREPVVGKAALVPLMHSVHADIESIDIEILRIGTIDGAVITERVDHFVMKHGGLGALPAVGIFTLRDGKIILWREYFDRVTLETQMATPVE